MSLVSCFYEHFFMIVYKYCVTCWLPIRNKTSQRILTKYLPRKYKNEKWVFFCMESEFLFTFKNIFFCFYFLLLNFILWTFKLCHGFNECTLCSSIYFIDKTFLCSHNHCKCKENISTMKDHLHWMYSFMLFVPITMRWVYILHNIITLIIETQPNDICNLRE